MFTKEFKNMVGKEAYERSSTFKELAIKYNVSIPTIQLWKNNYARELGLPENFNNIVTNPNADRRIKELENENLKLRIEIERLKKGYTVKGVGQRKEYISLEKRNTK